MLRISVSEKELFDERTEQFLTIPKTIVEMEHSLVSMSKWEAKYKKPFLSDNPKFAKTSDETYDYFRMMLLTPCDESVINFMNEEEAQQVLAYLKDSQTATWFTDSKKTAANTKEITSEVIYYWLTAFSIPFETESWNINRLMTLIQVCSAEQNPKKSGMSLADRGSLNRSRLNSMKNR